MYDTKTTPFSVMNTPYARDVTREVVRAFREQGIAIGFYFSPDDFHYLHRAGKPVARAPHPGVTPQEDPGLLAHDQAQLRELMTGYGPIDVVFLDGPAEGLREVVWDLQPDAVVTRGAIETPEQRIPGVPMDRPWEACLTMGTQWQYKPTHETYKSGTELIEILIETRAKGGNLLLNVGPKPDGELPIEQEERLREIAVWTFVNGEARVMGERKSFTIRSVAAGEATRVRVLGQSGEVLEYRPDVDPRPRWRQDEEGLHLSIMMAQRLYNDRRWPDPVVLEITGARPAFTPPAVVTGEGARRAGGAAATLRADLRDLGGAPALEVGFQYRRAKGVEELYARDEAWTETAFVTRSAPGAYALEVAALEPEQAYEFRAVAKHPLLTVFGEERRLPPVAASGKP